MNLNTELNALNRRYDDSVYDSVFDLIKQAKIFMTRYGGNISPYYTGGDKSGKGAEICVEYHCKVFNEVDKNYYRHYVTMKLRRKTRNAVHRDLIIEELYAARAPSQKEPKGLSEIYSLDAIVAITR